MVQTQNANSIPLLRREHHSIHVGQNSKSQSFDEFGVLVRQRRRTELLKGFRSRKQAILNSLIHLPAIGITLGVLSLTFRGFFWTIPSNDMNTYLNLLQFAAQFHGVLIISSLSAMLLHGVHLGLASEKGLPLGFVSSSFQLNSIAYLFRKEFRTLNTKYILSFVAIFMLALVSNPSSAITMIPRLQFWPIKNNWIDKGSVDFSVYIAANKQNLYPEILTAEHVPVKCLQANASILDSCPAYGMRHWMIYDNGFALDKDGIAPEFNMTIQGAWIRYMNGGAPPVFQGNQGVYVTSTLSNFLGNVLFAFEEALNAFGARSQAALGVEGQSTLQNKIGLSKMAARYDLTLRSSEKAFATRKPLVNVECTGHSTGTEDLTLPHDMMIWPPWTSNPIKSTIWSVPASDYSDLIVDINSTVVNSSLIDIAQFPGIKPSLGVFFSTPETLGRENFSLYTCTIDARWVETRAFSDASYGMRAIFDFNPSPISDAFTEGIERTSPSQPMYMSPSWTKALTVPWVDSILTPSPLDNRTIFDIIGQKCLDSNTYISTTDFQRKPFKDGLSHRVPKSAMGMYQCLQIGIAVTLAEAASRVQDSLPTYFVAEGHNLQVSKKSSIEYDPNPFQVSDIYSPMPQYVSADDGRIRNFTMQDFRDPERFTEIYISGARWGYGYGFRDSILIYVGVVVLLLHVFLSLVYVVWILWAGDYLDAGWDTIGGLVAMAMKSGTEGEREVDDKKTKWKGRFAVRDARNEGSTGGSEVENGEKEKAILVLRRVGAGNSGEEDGGSHDRD